MMGEKEKSAELPSGTAMPGLRAECHGSPEKYLSQPGESRVASQKLSFGRQFSQAKKGAGGKRELWVKRIVKVEAKGHGFLSQHNGRQQNGPMGRESRFWPGKPMSFSEFKEENPSHWSESEQRCFRLKSEQRF